MSGKRTRKTEANGGNAVYLVNLQIINGCLVFDACSGRFHRVSETAAFIISALKQQLPIPSLIAAYSRQYAISPTIAERDIELFLNEMAVVR